MADATTRRFSRVEYEYLGSRVLEVHREPVTDVRSPYRRRYASIRTLTDVDVEFPRSAPLPRIAIADLLP